MGNGCLQLRCCLGPGVELVDPSLEGVPELLNRIEIWRERRVRHDVDVVGLQEVLGHPGSVGAGVVLLEPEVLAPPEKRHNMGLQNFGDVAGRIHPVPATSAQILEEDRSNSRVQGNCPPHHDAGTSPSVVGNDVPWRKPFSTPSPDPYTPIVAVNAKPLLVRKEDPPPLPCTPVNVLLDVAKASLAVLKCERWAPGWSMVFQQIVSQASAHCSGTDLPSMDSHHVPGRVSSCCPVVLQMLTSEAAILGSCRHTWPAAPGTVIDTVGGV